MMRWVAACAVIIILVGCRTWEAKNPQDGNLIFDHGHSIPLEEYLANERELNEKYLYGSPHEALKALEALADLEAVAVAVDVEHHVEEARDRAAPERPRFRPGSGCRQ